jgi:hypothetical protein
VIDPAGGEVIGSPLGQTIGLLIEHILMLLISLNIPIMMDEGPIVSCMNNCKVA